MKVICGTCWVKYKHGCCEGYPHKLVPYKESYRLYDDLIKNFDDIHKDCPLIVTSTNHRDNFIKAFDRLYSF